MLPDPRSHKLYVGLKQSKKAIIQGSATKLFVARDADHSIIEEVKGLCLTHIVPIEYAENMRELGKACNIDVSAAVVALIKD